MSSSTIQFVVAGALIAAWAWMLGRPILTSLFRRSRRDSIGHFRYQQAVLSGPLDGGEVPRRWWTDRPRPFADWRDQPKERRRLQTMLGFALATFASMLLAIALRGLLIRLFALMAVCFLAYLCLAVVIGTMELRAAEAVRRQRASASVAPLAAASTVRGKRAGTTKATGSTGSTRSLGTEPIEAASAGLDEVPGPILEREVAQRVEVDEFLDEFESFGTGIFDEGFYEPIPELAAKPLTLDSSLLQPPDEALVDEPEAEAVAASQDADPGPTQDEPDRTEPTFTTPPPPKRVWASKRNKARPIYIEAQLDDEGRPVKAVND